jgi:hypothetical protein
LLARYAKEIIEHVDDVIVSLDGPTKVHHRIRRVPEPSKSATVEKRPRPSVFLQIPPVSRRPVLKENYLLFEKRAPFKRRVNEAFVDQALVSCFSPTSSDFCFFLDSQAQVLIVRPHTGRLLPEEYSARWISQRVRNLCKSTEYQDRFV